jgi:hypothetical protein
MKNYLFLCVFFLIFSCTNNKSVYWCGDHPCINNKEKEAYFKKTMIVEVRELKKESNKDISEFEKLLKQAQVDEKKRIMSEKGLAKQVRLEEKRRIKEEKELAKQVRLEEKRRIEEKKKLSKQARLEEKREKNNIWKDEKKLPKKEVSKTKNKETAINIDMASTNISSAKFKELAERITLKNKFRPFPNINDIPN